MIERCKNEVDDALGEVLEKNPIAEKLIRSKEENGHKDYRHIEEER